MNIDVQAIRPLLQRTINSLEFLYGLDSSEWSADCDGESLEFGRAEILKEELRGLWSSPDHRTLETLAWLVWESAVRRKQPTVWLLRSCSAETAIIFLLCVVTNIPLGPILDADLSDSQFHWLTSAIALLTASPLGVSESPEDEHFAERLELARWAPGAEVGVCDWILSPAEVRIAQRSEVRIIAPGFACTEFD